MRSFSLGSLLICLLGLWSLAGCGPKENREDDGSRFLVNGRTGDSEFSPSADVQTLYFDVYSEKKWDCIQEGFERSWVSYEMVRSDKKDTWKISLILTENTGNAPRTAVFIFTSGTLQRRVTVTQSVEDPVFRTHTIGAYGVPGGDVIFDRERFQYSRLHYGTDRLSFRLFNPSAVRLATLSGLSRNMEPGMLFTVLYRVQEGGLTRVSESYEVQVIRVKESLVWLKKDENTYFVLRK